MPRIVKSHAYYDSDKEGNLLCSNGDKNEATNTSTSTSTSIMSKKRSNVSIVTQFPLRKKQKLDAKKTAKYNKNHLKKR